MSRIAQPSYATPTLNDGTLAAASAGDTAFGSSRNCGVFTLAVGTYFVPIPCADALVASLHTQGDATIALTSVTLEETNFAPSDVSDYSDNVGEWVAVDVTRVTSTVEGTNWTNTSDVIANTAGNVGGAVQTVSDCASRRMRAKVVVGTGGQARFATWAKD